MKTLILGLFSLVVFSFPHNSGLVSDVLLEVRDVDGSLVPEVEIKQHPDVVHWALDGTYMLAEIEKRTHIFDVYKHAAGFFRVDNQKKGIEENGQLVDLNIVSKAGIDRYRDMLQKLKDIGKPEQAINLIEKTKTRYGETYLELPVFKELRIFESDLKEGLNPNGGLLHPGSENFFDPNNTDDAKIREWLGNKNKGLSNPQLDNIMQLIKNRDFEKLNKEILNNKDLFSKEQLQLIETLSKHKINNKL